MNRPQTRQEKREKSQRIRAMFTEYARTKDRKLREKLIVENLYIAEILAKKYANRGIEYDDLLQVASIGLIYAIDRYDASRGYEFSSFATPTIVGEIKRHFRDKGWVIRVPRRIQELIKKVNQVRNDLEQRNEKEPTVDEIAAVLRIQPEEVMEAMEASKVYAPQSLDRTVDPGDDDREVNLGDIVGEEDRNFDAVEFQDLVNRTRETMNDLEKKIFQYRYYDRKTQAAIAKELHISQMTVSRLEKKVLQKFRDALHVKALEHK